MSQDSPPTPPNPHRSVTHCEQLIGYQFRDKALLEEAITHASGANTRLCSNERLEFLGDSILGFLVCEALFRQFPDWLEGDLTRVKSAIVSRQTCSQWAEQLRLRDVLIVGKGVLANGDVPTSLMSDAFESIVAAIYLDGGLEPVREFLSDRIQSQIDRLSKRNSEKNFKSMLQQFAQRDSGAAPHYLVIEESGPDHNKSFRVAVQLGSRTFPPAWGKNKKEAEQRAAGNTLVELGQIPSDEAPTADDL
jgi:ribonuclease-3